MDMKSIESLNSTLLEDKSTLMFVSHGREFVNSTVTPIIGLSERGRADYHGTYKKFLRDELAE